MTNLNAWLAFLHVLASMVWLGAWAAICVFARNAVRDPKIDALRRLFAVMHSLGPTLLGPSTVLVLVTGGILVARSRRAELGDAWVLVGLGLYVAATLVGMLGLSRASRAAAAALDLDDLPAATVATRSWLNMAVAVTALLVLATADMVLRP